MKELTIPAYAKINLTLDVLGKRPDGYHDLSMVMQSVSLADQVIIRETGEEASRSGPIWAFCPERIRTSPPWRPVPLPATPGQI